MTVPFLETHREPHIETVPSTGDSPANMGIGTQFTLAGQSTDGVLGLWWRRYRTRRQLRQLVEQDPVRLHVDLGLTEYALYRECRKWFWEA